MRRFGRNYAASLWRNRVDEVVVFTIAAGGKVAKWPNAAVPESVQAVYFERNSDA